ncbi:MAG: segregation/condensation protein A [Sedimentisphaerales bacterium]|jgi:segregation and condensation protein A
MADYRVNLDIFAGPLDLLLYLVRKDEVDIYDIPIAKITDQYVKYIELLKSFDIDLAGDFLVMAATLMQIKSAMLLPKAETGPLQDEDVTDPRTELVRQLLEYKKYKDAANLLDAAAGEQRERYPRPSTIVERLKPDAEPELDIEQVSVWDLLEAFDLVCKSIGTVHPLDHIKDDTPIDLYQIEILHRLQTEGPIIFERIFESRSSRLVMVGLFLALLELVRERLVWAEQAANGAIFLRPLTEEPAEEAVRKVILAEAPEEQAVQDQPRQSPPIPIAELSPKDRTGAVSSPDGRRQSAVPIVEVPPEGKSTSPSQHSHVPPVQDHEGRTTG